eukprot:7596434-Ditylum_brightwellii.AAC.1
MDGVNPRCVLDELANTQELSHHTNQEIFGIKRKLDENAREISELRREVKDLREGQDCSCKRGSNIFSLNTGNI